MSDRVEAGACMSTSGASVNASTGARPRSGAVRQGIGAVRHALVQEGLARQSRLYRQHGRHEPDPHAPLVLVACSGGRDSLALARLGSIVCGELGLRCGAVLVDHGLQPGSAQVTRRAAAQCEKMGLGPVVAVRAHIDGAASGSFSAAGGEEAAARSARYRALIAQARRLRAAAVLLAHTRDDQAETLLLSLLKGSSPTALAGMPGRFVRGGVRFLRPLLSLSRAQTTAICRASGLTWWDDPTNGDGMAAGDPRFVSLPLRSRVRQELLPLMRRLGGGGDAVDAHLAAIARSQQEDQEYLRAQAQQAFEQLLVPPAADASQKAADSRVLLAPTGADPAGAAASRTAAAGPASRLVCLDTKGLRALPAPIRRRVLVTALACLVPGDLPESGINRTVLETLERFVLGAIPSPKCWISSNLSAFRQGAVTVLCEDVTHEDR